MGLLNKFKKEKKVINWENAYKATPKFYSKPDGNPFGAIALTEGTDTILPKSPQNEYAIDGKQITNWKIILLLVLQKIQLLEIVIILLLLISWKII